MFGNLGADDDFTACYGLSVDDRKRMLAVIRSAPKRQLASAAKVSTRTIPATLAAANEMSDAKLRRLFEAAASLVDEKQKAHSSDEETMVWLTRLVPQHRGFDGLI